MDFWAKTGPDDAYLPLSTRLADAWAVADRLWTLVRSLPQRVGLAGRLGVGVDEARSLVVFLCAAHDCGTARQNVTGRLLTLPRRA